MLKLTVRKQEEEPPVKKYRVIFSGDKYAVQVWIEGKIWRKPQWKTIREIDSIGQAVSLAEHLTKEGTLVWESEV